MKINRRETARKSGVYLIVCEETDRVYVGKSLNMNKRLHRHLYDLKSNKHCNKLMQQDFNNFSNSFSTKVVEFCEPNVLCVRELYWIKLYMGKLFNIVTKYSTDFRGDKNPNFDNRWSKDQKRVASERQLDRVSKGLHKISNKTKSEISELISDLWKQNPDKKKKMALNVKITKQKKYAFDQYSKDGKFLIRTWENVESIINENPTYKWQNIYSVCNGYKPTIYGYVWKKRLKI